jgi:glycosyltransferase involved in cell wall biosynthesis
VTIFLGQAGMLFWLIYFVIESILYIIKVPKLSSISPLHLVDFPLVSVILPARNEEKYIENCLESLLSQDYPNYEIIAVNDESFDKTGDLLYKYSISQSKITYIEASPIPKGWTGKNWACYQGYLKSKGSFFLFTDADTTFYPSTISLAITNLIFNKLDSITAIPKTLSNDFWTKITLPILWIFSAVRFSAIKANNPKTRIGFFYGSFFMIRRQVYETVGTHKIVSGEIAEDAELGRIVKEKGYAIRVFHGEKHIQALWSRNSLDLWHGLRRIIIPLYQNDRKKAFILIITPIVLLILPLLILILVIIIAGFEKDFFHSLPLSYLAIASILLVISNNILQLRYVLFQGLLYSLAFPLSGSLLLAAFVSSIVGSKQGELIKWRDRMYPARINDKNK